MQINTELHAPYHFIPQSKWVFSPPWAHLVSHDMPFQDGISGELKLRINALSDICVGGKNSDRTVDWAVDANGHPVIPGSSLKGMLRSVLEIATFSKMQFVDKDKRFAYRDFKNCDKYINVISNSKVVAGYVKKNSDGMYKFTACKYAKLMHEHVKEVWKIDKLRYNSSMVEKRKMFSAKTSKPLQFGLRPASGKSQRNFVKRVDLSGNEHQDGFLVLTGSRIGSKNKPALQFDYVFYGQDNMRFSDEEVTQAYREFEQGQIDANGNELEQFASLKKHAHPVYGYPVFLAVDKKTQKIRGMGIAQLPKLLYTHSVGALMANQLHNEPLYDFAETLFGAIKDDLGELSLRSRVHFADAPAMTKPTMSSREYAMSGPSPTFCAGYLQQQFKSSVKNFDGGTKINGWKRYPPKQRDYEPQGVTDNMKSTLKVVPQGTSFEASIMVHNLKPEELGALLWAIQLGTQRNERLAHNIGHGKPLGLGIVDVELAGTNLITTQYESFKNVQSSIDRFVACMNTHYPSDKQSWDNSGQIKMLQSFADYQQNSDRKELRYMDLEDGVSYKNSDRGMLFEWKDKGQPISKSEIGVTPQTSGMVQGRLTQFLRPENFGKYAPKAPAASEAFREVEAFQDLCVWLDNPEVNYKKTNVAVLFDAIKYFVETCPEDKVIGLVLLTQFETPEIKSSLKVKNKERAKERKALFAQLQGLCDGQ